MTKPVSLLALLAILLLAGSAQAAPSGRFTYALPSDLVRRGISQDKRYQGLLDSISTEGFDTWGRAADSIDIRVTGDKDVSKLRSISGGNLDFEVTIKDVQAVLDADAASRARTASQEFAAQAVPTDISYFNDYKTYPQIVEFAQTKCSQFSSLCEYIPSIGKTIEGRDIFALKVGSAGTNKPQIYIEGLIHAREWAGTTTVQYILFQLLEESRTKPEIADLLSKVDIHIVPVVNVDGYQHAQTSDRLWRKNRRRNSNGTFGVDLNRNFAYNWGRGGSSSTPSSDTYRGTAAESEPETKAVTNYFRSLPRVTAAVDVHTFSQLILRPWGDTSTNAEHETQHRQVTERMRDIIRGVDGRSYTAQKGIDLYATTGTASDWFYTVSKTSASGQTIKPYGITFELRPASAWGGSGFILPANQIIPTGREIYPAFLEYVRNSLANPLITTRR
ncbi:hypothetical protein BCR44DRAFT_1430632 [Catenaria anguillulae PL171]|uniref:Peptidase M14 domain-containing protein n=1 Tax=Catenaria anguillulae PL171 TaxID=765915 RepID=A0A1Y2HTS7_9FUNG|nr:hypothetical protein BCR44DRAFT_1430632 [Catenaria anguillulae PL171]